jgi:ferredoxin
LFHPKQADPALADQATQASFSRNSFHPMRHKITLQTPSQTFEIDCEEDRTILDAAEEAGLAGLELPYSCRQGMCGTCAGKLVSGEVKHVKESFMNADQYNAGYVILCSAYPRADCVIETDKQDDMYG